MRLRLYRENGPDGYLWFMDHGNQKCPITFKLETVGWGIKQYQEQEYLDVDILAYGERFQVSTQWGKLRYIERYVDEENTVAVAEFFISDGHPAAEFFRKTVTFDDGVERTVRIAHMKPTQPY